MNLLKKLNENQALMKYQSLFIKEFFNKRVIDNQYTLQCNTSTCLRAHAKTIIISRDWQ